jgi:hypothetical protein
MRKLAYILSVCLILFAFNSDAINLITDRGGAAPNCMSGTYVLAWNGDYPSDTDAACDSAQAKEDGAVNGSLDIGTDYGESGSVGIKADTVGESLEWADAADEFIDDDAERTIWIRAYMSATPDNDLFIFRATNGTQYLAIQWRTSGDIRGQYSGTGGVYNASCDVDSSTGGWVTIGYTYDTPNQDHAIDCDGSWDEDLNEIVTDFGVTNVDEIHIGAPTNEPGDAEYIQVDRVAIVDGYKAAKPSGW